MRSPKRGGSSDLDSTRYLTELGVEIVENRQPIQFSPNINEHIHRWAPYVQGFSSSFVQSILDEYRSQYVNPTVLDPFAGCGTVLVQAKLGGHESIGTELNPLLQFIANTKLNCWDVTPSYLLKAYNRLPRKRRSPAPSFLKSDSHFDEGVLRNLEVIKGGIESADARTEKQRKARDLMKVAFSSIIIECSKLKRSPCLGYAKGKRVEDIAPRVLMNQKIHQIAADLKLIQSEYGDFTRTKSEVVLANAKEFKHNKSFDLIITSPPYMNGMDYVINYKIEMGWLGFADSHRQLKVIKDDMVVCDNVSKGLIRHFRASEPSYNNDWLEELTANIEANIKRRGQYRRTDMPYIVHKYFDDMYGVMKKVASSLNQGGRFVLVVGDSLIADVYVPTDLLLARIGLDVGLDIERIEKARTRRSGQVRSYKLRESIVKLVRP